MAVELNIQQDLVKQKGWDQSEAEEEDTINALKHTLRPSELFVAGEFTSTIPQESRTIPGKSFQAHNPMFQTDIIRQTEIDNKRLFYFTYINFIIINVFFIFQFIIIIIIIILLLLVCLRKLLLIIDILILTTAEAL